MKKLLKHLFLAAALLSGTYLTADEPEPYASVRNISYEPYFLENNYILSQIVDFHATTNFIDVASNEGAAARSVAAYNPSTAKVYSINAWGENPHDFHKFLSNVKQENQAEKIIPIRMTSSEACLALNVLAEVIFIECSSQDHILENILRWESHLTENGAIVGNHWEWSEVELAVSKAATLNNLSLSTNGNYWILSK